MRVLGVGSLYPPHHFGGYEVIWQAATQTLRDRGHEVRVLTTDHHRPGVTASAAEDADVHRELRWYWHDHEFPAMGARERFALERHNARVMASHLEQFRPDAVVWWAMGGMSLSLLEQVRRAGIPALGIVGDAWMDYAFTFDAWQTAWRNRPRLAGLADRLTGIPTRVEPGPMARWLFISQSILDSSLELGGWTLPDTGLAHPGVDPERFAFQPAGAWSWKLLYAGRIDERKGIASAIEALALLPPEATLTIDGGGDEDHAAQLQRQAAELGLLDRVVFTRSPREDLAAVYAACDALIFPVTWDEPWGLVPLEAMSVGRPVVATGTGGSGEYLRDRENSLLFTPGDASALASVVRSLAEDEALRAGLVAGGRETAAHFTEDAFHDVVEGELEALPRR